jgi:hypothetical protein
MSDLPILARAAAEILAWLASRGRQACVIGGVAVARWGEPRTTQDVDLTVRTEFGTEEAVLEDLLARFQSRIPDPRPFALQNRIVLLTLTGGINADVSFASFPFELEAVERSSPWSISSELALRTCSAEDLIVYKLVAARPGDIQDVMRIVQRQGRRLDVARIRYWGAQFAELKEDPDLLRPFEDSLKRLPAET